MNITFMISSSMPWSPYGHSWRDLRIWSVKNRYSCHTFHISLAIFAKLFSHLFGYIWKTLFASLWITLPTLFANLWKYFQVFQNDVNSRNLFCDLFWLSLPYFPTRWQFMTHFPQLFGYICKNSSRLVIIAKHFRIHLSGTSVTCSMSKTSTSLIITCSLRSSIFRRPHWLCHAPALDLTQILIRFRVRFRTIEPRVAVMKSAGCRVSPSDCARIWYGS